MPTPAKTSPDALIGIARSLVDRGGPDAVTLNAVAQAAGVKAPSLYKHFADRAALLKAVEIGILIDLEAALRAGTRGRTPRQRLRAMAVAYRAFALEQPQRYGAIYSPDAFADPEIEAACRFAAMPMFEELRASGLPEARVLPLARTLTAFMHGFVTMEIVRAFRFGGDVETDFQSSLETILHEIPA